MFQIIYCDKTSIGGDLVEEIAYTLTEVRLSLRRIAEQNSVESGLIVPVWDFYATVRIAAKDGRVAYQESSDPILTVNAIDGSVIDIAKGY